MVESLLDELSHPRQGVTAIVQRLMELFVIQGLRAELTDGFWSAPGWLGMLTDPVLRTGLGDAECISAPRSVEMLASVVHRSPRRIWAHATAFAGETPGRLLRQLRIQRAFPMLEGESPKLADIARDLGYANVSAFCRAFRREVGCTPAEYHRRVTGRPFPRAIRCGAPDGPAMSVDGESDGASLARGVAGPAPRSSSPYAAFLDGDLGRAVHPYPTMPVEPVSAPAGATARDTARRMLTGYRDGVVSLESLISWAEQLEASAPSDPWLLRTAQSLADPLLCRERAMAFVRDLLAG